VSDVRTRLHDLRRTNLVLTTAAAVVDLACFVGIGVTVGFVWRWLPWETAATVSFAATVLMARPLRALENLVHEASHYNWSRTKWLNDAAATFLAAFPVLLTVGSYRNSHLRHHNEFGTANDPDLRRFMTLDMDGLDRSSPWRLAVGMVRRLPRYETGWIRSLARSRGALAGVVWYGVLLVVMRYLGVPIQILWVALIGMLWAMLVTLPVLRLIGESEEHLYSEGTIFAATVSNVGLLHRWYVHPHGDAYHLEHHLHETVPWFNVRRLSKLLVKSDKGNFGGRRRFRTRLAQYPKRGEK
jgi:fatty acid desaturase